MALSDRARMLIESHPLRDYFYTMLQKESGGNPNLVSKTGAAGPWQFTRGTGKLYGLLADNTDKRKDDVESTKAMIKLTEDNRRTMNRMLGREPTLPELALAHQQGAETGVRMLSGVGNAKPQNLAVNNVSPNLPPQAAASKIMAYYFPDKLKALIPGLSLASNPVTQAAQAPQAPLLTAPPQAPMIPQAGLTPGPGSPIPPQMPPPINPAGLTPGPPPINPAGIVPGENANPASFKERFLGADLKGGEGTPFDQLTKGLGDVTKGLTPKVDPAAAAELAKITPMSASPLGSGDSQMAMQLMSQLLANRRKNYGLSLTGVP